MEEFKSRNLNYDAQTMTFLYYSSVAPILFPHTHLSSFPTLSLLLSFDVVGLVRGECNISKHSWSGSVGEKMGGIN